MQLKVIFMRIRKITMGLFRGCTTRFIRFVFIS